MEIVKLKGKIKVVTGLHIGGGDDVMKIGGIDNGVIKDVNTDRPYIPGSSLKGKMRSLLEWHFGLVGISNGEPFSSKYLNDPKFQSEEDRKNAINLLKLFGDKDDEDGKIGITRISVGDCFLTEEFEQKTDKDEIKLTEAKYENVIDRATGTAKHPRQTERVVAGVEFNYDIRIKVLPTDDKEEFINIVETALKLIEDDYLGGNGSRGYGRVKFIKE
ncbi:type III-A CRISPR-associated RAMP protein Csm3 [Nitratiruptor sp. YY09-18]|uniref:type III-A CRISPR-associated RAMP protein Csm3 n=1 Tax=Nitratiruptor sp. YY09-18 TaxID=2724901 RepID=UPI0019168241|nr:type III-A CRISPR-associated RAMP protein Csm3 [Nitratiruptor sp. YY09-18]BCD68479.1 CRISPR-associated protein Csm3 [Nitratiruptor sp. YY09-18]